MYSSSCRLTLSLLGILTLGAPVFAANQQPGSADKEPTMQTRRDMARVHREVADCLDSSRPMSDCRQEMMSRCKQMWKDGHCPMMEGGKISGMRGDGMGSMKKQSESK